MVKEGASDIDVHFEIHLGATRQAELEFPGRQTRMVQSFCVDPFQGLADDLPELATVVGSWQQMDHDLFYADFQHPWGLGQVAKVIMIVPVIVVSLLERLQRLVEQVPGGDSQHIHQSLALAVHFYHLALDHRIQARFLGLRPVNLSLDFLDASSCLVNALSSLKARVFVALIGCLEGRHMPVQRLVLGRVCGSLLG